MLDINLVTLEHHLEALRKLRNIAVIKKQFSAAISAEIARGKAAGLYVEKCESTVTTRNLDPLPDEAFIG